MRNNRKRQDQTNNVKFSSKNLSAFTIVLRHTRAGRLPIQKALACAEDRATSHALNGGVIIEP
jgi:hypothetical protein